MREERNIEALRVFSARLLAEPTNVWARSNRGVALLALERWEEAVREFTVVVADPRAAAVAEYHSLAWCYRNLDRPLEVVRAAQAFFQRATLRHFAAIPTLQNLAWAAERLRHPAMALALHHQVMCRDPGERDFEELARAYWAEGLVPHFVETLRFAAERGVRTRAQVLRRCDALLGDALRREGEDPVRPLEPV